MEEARKMKCYKRLIYKQFVQVSCLCDIFRKLTLGALAKLFFFSRELAYVSIHTFLYLKWLYCWKSRRETFFCETAFLFWCHALWKLESSNCCVFEMKHAMGKETCTKIYFWFIFNLVWIRIRKTSLFLLYNLMTSLCKLSINQNTN